MQYYTLQQASAELNKIISRAVFEVSVHSPLPFAGSAAILTAISAGVTPALPRGSEHLLFEQEESAIVSDNGTVFLIPQKEFESMREILRLLSDKRSLNALLEGHSRHDAGLKLDSQSVEQIFYDLQDTHS